MSAELTKTDAKINNDAEVEVKYKPKTIEEQLADAKEEAKTATELANVSSRMIELMETAAKAATRQIEAMQKMMSIFERKAESNAKIAADAKAMLIEAKMLIAEQALMITRLQAQLSSRTA